MKDVKTNAMRQLDAKKVKYEVYTYDTDDGMIDGISVAQNVIRMSNWFIRLL